LDALDQERQRLESQGNQELKAQPAPPQDYLQKQTYDYQPPIENYNQPPTNEYNPTQVQGQPEYGNSNNPKEAEQKIPSRGNSYMESKKEELKQWKLEQEKLKSMEKPQMNYNPPVQYQDQKPQQPSMDPEIEREMRRQKMEQELAEQMAKMNIENEKGMAGSSYAPPEPIQKREYGYPGKDEMNKGPSDYAPQAPHYGAEVQPPQPRISPDYAPKPVEPEIQAPAYIPQPRANPDYVPEARVNPDYMPQARPNPDYAPHNVNQNAPSAAAISKSREVTPAGGKSIRKQSEENKFNLSGYNQEMNGQNGVSGQNVYETSSHSYGNYDAKNLSKSYRILIVYRYTDEFKENRKSWISSSRIKQRI